MPVFALIDCNAFYCSCERICQPALKRKPVVVLSNNDGCVIARTAEVKALGIPMGAPYFKVRDQLAAAGVVVRSSNYTLYADISNRVMTVLASMLPGIEVYSIDEAWGDMTGVQEDLTEYGKRIRARLLQWVGMPVGVGISTTKTLAKLANWAAKKWPATGGVVDLTDPVRQERLLRIAPVGEVWGVGRRLAETMEAMGIQTAWDLASYPHEKLAKAFNITVQRTARELRGEACYGLSEGPPPKQAICSSKMFGDRLSHIAPIREAMATYTTRAAEKLRAQAHLCSVLQVSLQTQLHNPKQPIYANRQVLTLAVPTDDTRTLVAAALDGLDRIYRPGYEYAKCAVLLMHLEPRQGSVPDLFAERPDAASQKLMAVMDQINQREGRGTVRLGRVPINPDWGMRRDMLSRAYTTDWDELIAVRC